MSSWDTICLWPRTLNFSGVDTWPKQSQSESLEEMNRVQRRDYFLFSAVGSFEHRINLALPWHHCCYRADCWRSKPNWKYEEPWGEERGLCGQFESLVPTVPEAKLPSILDFPVTRANQLLLCFSCVIFLSLATERYLTNAGVAKERLKSRYSCVVVALNARQQSWDLFLKTARRAI